VVEIDQHLLVIDLNRVDVDGFRGWQAEGAAASQVKTGAVEVALYRAILDVPVAQGDVPVTAEIVDGEVFAPVKHDGDLVLVDGERDLGDQLVEGGNSDEAH